MASIKGTQTEKNLLAAFAGESQARNRYTYFAGKARNDGYIQISQIFEETANQEKEHAKRFFSFLEGGNVEINADGLVEGNREGNYDGFVPITGNIGTLSFAPKLSNIMSVSASYSLKPFSFLSGSILARLQSSISVSLLFKPSAGPTSEGGLDPTLTDDFSYLGSEFDATLNFRPMSDLGLGLRVGMFLPNGEVFDSDNQEPQIKGSLELSFSM